MHTASITSGRPNEPVCGVHTVSLASETTLQEGGGTNALLTRGFPFRLLPPSPSYSHFCLPRSLGLHDVAFTGRRFCCVMWHGRLLLAVGDVAFDGGPERWLLEMGDMADVVPPHPSMRGGAVLVLKYRKVTRPGIEPRTFWTYTRCSNQLSYLALEFNQLILYLCNCQPKDTYSARHIQCHSLHARSTL